MDRTLHNANNAQRILELTADTMLLIDRNGICVDIDSHCDLWFLQEEVSFREGYLRTFARADKG